MNIKTLLSVAAISLLLLSGCGDDATPVETVPQVVETPEEELIASNCHILQTALDEFAYYNRGEYPREIVMEYNDRYDQTKDLLPEGRFLWNPYTWSRLEPSVDIASSSGEIGFMPVVKNNYCIGYRITGFGDDSLIVDISNITCPEDTLLLVNCFVLRDAVMDYANDNGYIYPFSVDTPANAEGKILLDYLPGGILLENPLTGMNTEPSGWIAYPPGMIGYNPVMEMDFCIGFEITGAGCNSLYVTMANTVAWPNDAKVLANCQILRAAVEAFAAANGGVYPAAAADATPGGDTVYDLLPDGSLLINPYTGVPTEPAIFGGSAATPGQTGYCVVVIDHENVGYVITGVGRCAGDVIVTICNIP